ncbi:MAG: DNA translocase FtsK, partial [Patescibacteria group bacterium]|nr:DNA translocase FtsK [Patescibacteria group bacterium]
ALLLLSYTRQGSALLAIYDASHRWFGPLAFLSAFGIILFGFLFLRLKMVLSRPHVTIGYFVAMISFLGLVKTGTVGFTLYSILSEILGTAGSDIVYVAGLIIGLVVMFDTSVDELLGIFTGILEGVSKILPGGFLAVFKSKKMVVKDNKQMAVNQPTKQPPTIKGSGVTVPTLATAQKPGVIVNNKKDLQPGAVISDKLVSNVLDGRGEGIWEYPPLSLLAEGTGHKADRGDIKKIAATIERTLQSFGIDARVAEVNLGPAVTQYALEIALGTKVSKITSLANDLALATEAPTGQIRIEAPIPGRNLIGIEIPNRSLEIVTLRTMLASNAMQKSKSKLTVSLGLDVSGNPVVSDIAKMPHV